MRAVQIRVSLAMLGLTLALTLASCRNAVYEGGTCNAPKERASGMVNLHLSLTPVEEGNPAAMSSGYKHTSTRVEHTVNTGTESPTVDKRVVPAISAIRSVAVFMYEVGNVAQPDYTFYFADVLALQKSYPRRSGRESEQGYNDLYKIWQHPSFRPFTAQDNIELPFNLGTVQVKGGKKYNILFFVNSNAIRQKVQEGADLSTLDVRKFVEDLPYTSNQHEPATSTELLWEQAIQWGTTAPDGGAKTTDGIPMIGVIKELDIPAYPANSGVTINETVEVERIYSAVDLRVDFSAFDAKYPADVVNGTKLVNVYFEDVPLGYSLLPFTGEQTSLSATLAPFFAGQSPADTKLTTTATKAPASVLAKLNDRSYNATTAWGTQFDAVAFMPSTRGATNSMPTLVLEFTFPQYKGTPGTSGVERYRIPLKNHSSLSAASYMIRNHYYKIDATFYGPDLTLTYNITYSVKGVASPPEWKKVNPQIEFN